MYPVGTFSVFTLKRTDTTLDLSQTAEKVRPENRLAMITRIIWNFSLWVGITSIFGMPKIGNLKKKKEIEKYRMRGSNSRPLACEASVIATTPTRLLFWVLELTI